MTTEEDVGEWKVIMSSVEPVLRDLGEKLHRLSILQWSSSLREGPSTNQDPRLPPEGLLMEREDVRVAAEVADDTLHEAREVIAEEIRSQRFDARRVKRMVAHAEQAVRRAMIEAKKERERRDEIDREIVAEIRARASENARKKNDKEQKEIREKLERVSKRRERLEKELKDQLQNEQRLNRVLEERQRLKKKLNKIARGKIKRMNSFARKVSNSADKFEADVRSHSKGKVSKKFREILSKQKESKYGRFWKVNEQALDNREKIAADDELERHAQRFEMIKSRESERRSGELKEERLRRVQQLRESLDSRGDSKRAEAAESDVKRFKDDIFAAIRSDDANVLKSFFVLKGVANVLNTRERRSGRTLLHCAAFWGCKNVTACLINIGCDVDVIDTAYRRYTPLFDAARGGHIAVCEELLAGGANMHHRDVRGDTALHLASRSGQAFVITRLVKWNHRFRPHEAAALLSIRNDRGRTPRDVAKTGDVRNAFDEAEISSRDLEEKRAKRRQKLARAVSKATVASAHGNALWKARGRRLRYGEQGQ